jgi:hypothetical protein
MSQSARGSNKFLSVVSYSLVWNNLGTLLQLYILATCGAIAVCLCSDLCGHSCPQCIRGKASLLSIPLLDYAYQQDMLLSMFPHMRKIWIDS